jgi:signal transduction histidine kinase
VALSAVPLLPFDLLNPIYPDYHNTRTYRNLRRKMLRLQKATGVRRIYVFDRKRKSLMDTRKVNVGTLYVSLSFEALELDEVFRGKTRASVLFRDQKGVQYKTGFAPIYDGKRVVAAVAVEGSAAYFSTLRNTQQELALYGFLSLLLVIGAGVMFARWLAQPVRQLVQVAQNIGEGHLTEEVPKLGRDEIGFLAETMEEMRQNILTRDSQMQMMLSGIAHEVRNPLGGMELFSGILIEELEDDPEKRSHVERIQRETRYLSNVVNSFLDFARPTPLDIQAHDWSDFSFELSMLLMSDLEPKKIEMKIDNKGELPKIPFDKSRIQQTLLNLLQNAIHASPEGGIVTLRASIEGDLIRVDVCDQGEGIPQEKLESIFEPFFTTKEKGTGLGLPLAKKFVELHKGTMSMTSELGVGTTVSLTLPLTATQELYT